MKLNKTSITADLLRAELRKLPEDMRTVLVMRFWQNETIEDISKQIRKSWDQTNQLIADSLEAIKNGPIAVYVARLRDGA